MSETQKDINCLFFYLSGIGSSVQVVGYKVGALFGGGLLAWLSVFCGWEWLFCLWGSFYILVLLLLITHFYSKQITQRKELPYKKNTSGNPDLVSSDCANSKNGKCKHGETGTDESQISLSDGNKTGKMEVRQILRKIFQTPGFLWLVSFVLIYKLGEQGVASILPLFLIDQGIPHNQVGVMSGIFGQISSIAGSTVGGWIVGLHSGER